MDEKLPDVLGFFAFMLSSVVFVLVLMVVVNPVFISMVIPLTIIYVHAVNYFRCTNREVKRLDSISKSPIYAHFSETLNGLPTIRAYKDGNRLSAKIRGLVDYNNMAYWTMRIADRWLATRLETLGNLLVFANAILLVAMSKDISPSMAGLSMGFCMQATGMLNWLVRMYADVEANMASVERILHFSNDIPQEKSVNPMAGLQTDADQRPVELPEDWPNAGALTFKGYSMRYRDGLELVLKNLDIEIKAGEKIGVCGRTGSGKSSMLLSILRLVEAAEGAIVVDGIDLATASLRALRNRVSIIPQVRTSTTSRCDRHSSYVHLDVHKIPKN